jgi:hypothetical protein
MEYKATDLNNPTLVKQLIEQSSIYISNSPLISCRLQSFLPSTTIASMAYTIGPPAHAFAYVPNPSHIERRCGNEIHFLTREDDDIFIAETARHLGAPSNYPTASATKAQIQQLDLDFTEEELTSIDYFLDTESERMYSNERSKAGCFCGFWTSIKSISKEISLCVRDR